MKAVEDQAQAPGSGLDAASRQALVHCLRRIALPVTVAMWPCMTGAWTLGEAMGLLTAWLWAGSIVSAVVASIRKDAFAAGSLNFWDECLLNVALSRLAHLLQMHAG